MSYEVLAKVIEVKGNKAVIKFFGNLKVDDKLIIKIKKKRRTLKQNSFYWLFCQYCARELGMTAEELHEAFKIEFLKKSKVLPDGRKIRFVKSTTELNKQEFAEYFEKCNLLMSEMGVDVSTFWSIYQDFKK